jgi:hypothetical protein
MLSNRRFWGIISTHTPPRPTHRRQEPNSNRQTSAKLARLETTLNSLIPKDKSEF